MDKLTVLFIVAVSFTGLTHGVGLLPDGPLNKTVGGTVMFTTVNPPEGPFLKVTWMFGDTSVFVSTAQKNTTDPGYEGRVTYFPSTVSLELRSLSLSDSGEYTVRITGDPDDFEGLTTLGVYERITAVTAHANDTDLEEFSSVRLSCSSSGSSLSFLWMNDSSEVTASDRVQLTDGGSTLTITNVSRYDQGPYSCHVSNPVSNGVSNNKVHLTISYGPENVILSPSQEYFEKGSNVVLSCHADSRPEAQFDWFLNGSQQSHTGPELRLTNIQESQSGNYSCRAFNAKTEKYETSLQSPVTVLERISSASITSSTKEAEEGKSVNLTCDAAGSVFTRKWMKDGSDLTQADFILHDNNRVLFFQRLSKTDTGEYSCKISNPINTMEAKYHLVVNYGPERPTIKGDPEVSLGQTITLTCDAKSEPPANYTWLLDGTEIHNSPEYTKNKAEQSDSGNYTCQADNIITGGSSSSVFEVTVTEKTAGLSPGAIAGIIIACLIVASAAAAGGYMFYKKKKSPKASANQPVGGRGQDNTAYSGNKELNYVDIAVFRRRDGGAVQLGSQNETSVYAQVRGNNTSPSTSSPPTYDAHIQRTKRPASNGDELYSQVHKPRSHQI